MPPGFRKLPLSLHLLPLEELIELLFTDAVSGTKSVAFKLTAGEKSVHHRQGQGEPRGQLLRCQHLMCPCLNTTTADGR